jgi:asparagine synthase (glutamine-hydrolysing)
MCGIAGFLDTEKDMHVLEAMTSAVARRGPDDVGHYLQDGVGMGQRRLAIIDLSPGGHQPMLFEHLVTVFNGEIYNYKEVRAELISLGYRFTTSSDTEVVLKAFDRWGPECANRFIGMFALAVFDTREQALYLVRDRVGVKPLYWYWRDGRAAFGSELRCFKPYLTADERGAIDAAGLSSFMALGYVTENRSIVSGVAKVPAGHYVRIGGGRATVHRYWGASFSPDPAWQERKEEDLVDELEALVDSAFRYRMVADVPVGVFLSAGIDSSLVTCVLSRHFPDLRTFTIGFEEKGYDESADARRIAEHLGTRHSDAILRPEKAYEILEKLYDVYDEPFGDSSCVPTTFVAEIAKAGGVKVVLSADGGDELFGGYTRYWEFPARWAQVQRLGPVGATAARLLCAARGTIASAGRAERLRRFADILRHRDYPDFLQAILRPLADRDYRSLLPGFAPPAGGAGDGRDPLSLMAEWDLNHYLPDDILVKVDRATMYHSIEGREPFLDHRLIEFAAKLPLQHKVRGSEGKLLLKRLLGRYLPEPLWRLPKRGFGVPWAAWTRDFYRGQFVRLLDEGVAEPFDRKAVTALFERYSAGAEVNYTIIWYLFSYHAWHRKWRSDA